MRPEGITDRVVNKHKIDLTSWTSIFKSLRLLGLNVIIEDEQHVNEANQIYQVKTKGVHLGALHHEYDLMVDSYFARLIFLAVARSTT